MGFYIIKFFEIFYGYLRLLLYKALYLSQIHYSWIRPGRNFLFYIKNAGSIRLEKIVFRKDFFIFSDGGSVYLSKGVFINNNCSISSRGDIFVGENTLFGENVKLYDHDHQYNSDEGVCKNLFIVKPISIGKNCWIGSNVLILKGVTICDNTVVGAGSVVRDSISIPGLYVMKEDKLVKVK